MTHGLHGHTGDLSGQDLLHALQQLHCSGTLILAQHHGVMLFLLGHGKIQAGYRLGHAIELEETAQRYHFEPHPPSDTPELRCHFPSSSLPVLRALPAFGPSECVPAGLIELRELIPALRERTFTGCLSLTHQGERGAILFLDGSMGAAVYERDGYVFDQNDALRIIYRYSLDQNNPPLRLRPLPREIAQSLLGLYLKRRTTTPELSDYTGLQAKEDGFTFFHEGKAYLHITAELTGSSQRYTPCDSPPDLKLPEDPPGWEEQRYTLTLRGRDALNPMTDLAMRFNDSFGSSGKHILTILDRGLSIEEAAHELELELQELKPWLKRLEEDGLIRLIP